MIGSSTSGFEEAGPIVATIFVRRGSTAIGDRLAAAAAEGVPARIRRPLAELLLDPAEPVVLRDPVATARSAGLDLARAGRDHEVGDRGVLGLARAVGDDGCIAVLTRQRDRVERLRQRADLVDLDENRVRGALLDSAPQPVEVR